MTASKKRAGPAADLARIETFFALQLKHSDPLPQPERDKIEDLRDDAAWADTQANRQRLGRLNWLGRSFAGFERWAGTLRPGGLLRKMEQLTRGETHSAEAAIKPHPVPAGTSDAPLAFAADFHLFDRLSLHYGGDFRGAVLINYLLGTLGSAAIISFMSPPLGLEGFIEWIHKTHPKLDFPYGLVLETACILSILIIFWVGRTPERAGDSPRAGRRWFGRRWHQRWLEYRVLAERFRYLELLLPFGKQFVQGPPFVPERDANRYWHNRYFIWRATDAEIETQSARQYRQRTLAVMAAQEQYHTHNHRRRGTIARRLHLIAAGLFLLSLCIGAVDLALRFFNHAMPQLEQALGGTLLFFAALLPVFSAAIHGVLAHTEYTKLAETSAEIAVRIHDQYEQLAAIDVADEVEAARSLEPLRDAVFAFAETAINEATGWTATLRDKNVPLA